MTDIVERVAAAVRKARFDRTGRGKAYDPTLPLHETEIADVRAAIAEVLKMKPYTWEYSRGLDVDYTPTQVIDGAWKSDGWLEKPLYDLSPLKEALK